MPKNRRTSRGKSRISSNFSAQHLLINKQLSKDMIDMAKITPNDTVIDIGAGKGAITFPLAKRAARVIAVENDPVFAEKLLDKMQGVANIRMNRQDFLQFNLPKSPFSVVANIPFSITTPILGKLLDDPAVPLQRAVLIMEKGAAKRFTSVRITNPRILKWRMWFDLRLVRTVSPDHFSPPPKVESAIVTIFRKQSPLVPLQAHARFMALATYILQQPQAPVFAALQGVFTPSQIKHVVKALRLERNQAVSSLNEQQWGQLFHSMLRYVDPSRWPKVPKKKMPKIPRAKAPKMPKPKMPKPKMPKISKPRMLKKPKQKK